MESLIAVDYQTIHIGSPINDLLYFIICCCDGIFRKENYRKLIDHYYECFKKSLKQLNLDCDKLYPRTNFDADLQERLPLALFIAYFILPIILIDSKEAFVFDGTKDIDDFRVNPTSLLKERLNSILEEYHEFGLL